MQAWIVVGSPENFELLRKRFGTQTSVRRDLSGHDQLAQLGQHRGRRGLGVLRISQHFRAVVCFSNHRCYILQEH